MQVPFAKPLMGDEEKNEILNTLDSGWLTTGPKTERFEREFADYIGRRYAVGVTSCTAAMHLSLLALSGNNGSRYFSLGNQYVITPVMSWVATPNAILYAGFEPWFTDVLPDTLNIDMMGANRINPAHVFAILPVHLYGYPCDMDRVMHYAAKHDLRVISDCAHTVEARYNGKNVGCYGDVACYSFWGTKNLSCGEGGMIVTDSSDIASRLRELRNFGINNGKRNPDGSYSQTILGYKYNMFDLQASLGIHQLQRLEKRWATRNNMAGRYTELLRGINGIKLLPQSGDSIKHAHHLYIIRVRDRDRVAAILKERGIATSRHFQPLHLEPYYLQWCNHREGDFPVAEQAGREILSLPFWPEMTFAEQDYVVQQLREALS